MDELRIVDKAMEMKMVSLQQLRECRDLKKNLSGEIRKNASWKDLLTVNGYLTMEDWDHLSQLVDEDVLEKQQNSKEGELSIEQEENTTLSQRKSHPKIEGYEIVEELCHGSMGTTYIGVQLSMEREVVIKVLDADLAQDPVKVDKFVRESRAIARLGHRNIIGGIDAGKTVEGLHYFVMEFVKGESLLDMLQRKRRFSPTRSVYITKQIIKALEYAENMGMAHRELHPRNIMMTSDENPKLCDIGLEKRQHNNGTSGKMEFCDPHYICPEQIHNIAAMDQRSDIYLIGLLLFQMNTGQLPFHHPDPWQLCQLHLSQEPENPRTLVPNLPILVAQVILKCLRKKPTERYQNYQELKGDLDKFIRSLRPQVLSAASLKTSRTLGQSQIRPRPASLGASVDFNQTSVLPLEAKKAQQTIALPKEATSYGDKATSIWKIALLLFALFCFGVFSLLGVFYYLEKHSTPEDIQGKKQPQVVTQPSITPSTTTETPASEPPQAFFRVPLLQLAHQQLTILQQQQKFWQAWQQLRLWEKHFSQTLLSQQSQWQKMRSKLAEQYLAHYAVPLLFEQPFSHFSPESLEFRIHYTFEQPQVLRDFLPHGQWQISGGTLFLRHNFGKLYWKGSLAKKGAMQIVLAPLTEPKNIGLVFHKPTLRRDQLAKHFLLLHFEQATMLEQESGQQLPSHASPKLSQLIPLGLGEISDTTNFMEKYVQESMLLKGASGFHLQSRDVAKMIVQFRNQQFQTVLTTPIGKKMRWRGKSHWQKGHMGVYAGTPIAVAELEIKGILDKKWVEQIRKQVQQNAEHYLHREFELPPNLREKQQ